MLSTLILILRARVCQLQVLNPDKPNTILLDGGGVWKEPRKHPGEDDVPTTAHSGKHFTASETVPDIVIGMSDGLTVPFALAAGLSGAVASTGIAVTAGLAEIAAGSIAMGPGGYLAATSDTEHYDSELRRKYEETERFPDKEEQEVREVFLGYGLQEEQIEPIVSALRKDRSRWVDFMMRFESGLEKSNPKRAR
jgi:vacuolar iron transporter family protein